MSLRVLLVDDNAQFLQAARDLLEREGITVAAVASTSAEALELAEAMTPDVVLVDVDLGAESGFVLAERLARPATGGPVLPVVLISTYAEEDLADLLDASPAVGFLSKADLSASALLALLGPLGDGSSSGTSG